MKTAEEFLKQNYTVTYRHLANGDGNNIKAFAIYEAMEEYANQSKWISVNDRLPDNEAENSGMSYPVMTINQYGFYNVLCYDFELKQFTNKPYSANPTHWQPLPEKP